MIINSDYKGFPESVCPYLDYNTITEGNMWSETAAERRLTA